MAPVGVRFELFVENVERSLAFYGAALGLQPPAGYDPQGYVPASAGLVRIGLQRRSALPAEHHFRPAHFDGVGALIGCRALVGGRYVLR